MNKSYKKIIDNFWADMCNVKDSPENFKEALAQLIEEAQLYIDATNETEQ
jgi:hypothetical protein